MRWSMSFTSPVGGFNVFANWCSKYNEIVLLPLQQPILLMNPRSNYKIGWPHNCYGQWKNVRGNYSLGCNGTCIYYEPLRCDAYSHMTNTSVIWRECINGYNRPHSNLVSSANAPESCFPYAFKHQSRRKRGCKQKEEEKSVVCYVLSCGEPRWDPTARWPFCFLQIRCVGRFQRVVDQIRVVCRCISTVLCKWKHVEHVTLDAVTQICQSPERGPWKKSNNVTLLFLNSLEMWKQTGSKSVRKKKYNLFNIYIGFLISYCVLKINQQ